MKSKLQIVALLTLGAVVALGPIVRAEDTPSSPPPGAGGGATSPGGQRRASLDKFLTDIKATDDQKDKLKTIFKERVEKMQALRDDTSLSQEDRAKKRKEITDASNAKVKGVLNADQYTKYEEFMKTQAARFRNRGQQPPPPADSTPKN
jgi:Spy/CpxP family protein refolding chaperone